MKKLLLLTLVFISFSVLADDAKNEWHDTTLSDATIEKIQTAKYNYKKCVSDEMLKAEYQTQESRQATETIMKQCESFLTKMREIYLDVEVPAIIADRHLRQTRIQTTREVLQNMMYAEAARSDK